MALLFLHGKADEVIPTTGVCPQCSNPLRWGDVVMQRQKRRLLALEKLDVTL